MGGQSGVLNAADIEMVKISLACVFPNSVILKVSEQIRAAKSELPKLPKKRFPGKGYQARLQATGSHGTASQTSFARKVPKHVPKQGSQVSQARFLGTASEARLMLAFQLPQYCKHFWKITLLRVTPTVTFMQFTQYFMSEIC